MTDRAGHVRQADNRSTTKTTVGEVAPDFGAYDRFEALTRKLVRVPKEEMERERDREKAARKD